MTRLLVFGLLTLLRSEAYAGKLIAEGVPASSNTIMIDTTNVRVGIGTSKPQTRIHMSSGTLLIDGNGSPAFQVGISSFIITRPGKVVMGNPGINASINIQQPTNSDYALYFAQDNSPSNGWLFSANSVNGNLDISRIGAGTVSLTPSGGVSGGGLFSAGSVSSGGNISMGDDLTSSALLIGSHGSYLGRQNSDGSTILHTGQAHIELSGGGVKIGTGGPGATLDVDGTGQYSGKLTVMPGAAARLQLGDASANQNAELLFVNSNSAKNFMIGNNANVAGGLEFTRSTAGGGSTFSTPDLYIDSSGKIVTNPGANGRIQMGDASSNANSELIFLNSNSANNFIIGSNANVSGALEFTPSTAGGGSTFSTPAMTIIGSNSRVGIGTTNPSTTLDVNGTLNVSGAFSVGGGVGLSTSTTNPFYSNQLFDYMTSNDGATQSAGCVVAYNFASGAPTATLIFTSTTTGSTASPMGVLLESCAPGAICKVGIHGIYNVTTDGGGLTFENYTAFSGTRCDVANSATQGTGAHGLNISSTSSSKAWIKLGSEN